MKAMVIQPLCPLSNEPKRLEKKCKSTSTSTLNTDPIKRYELAQLTLREQQKKAFKEMKKHLGPSLRLAELNGDLAKDSSKSSMDLSSDDLHDYFTWGGRNSGSITPVRHVSIVEHEDEDQVEEFSISSSVRRDLKLLDELYGSQE